MLTIYSSSGYNRSRWAYTLECAFEYFVSLMVTDSLLASLLTNLGMSDGTVGVISSLISVSFLFQLCALPVIRKITHRKRFAVTVHCMGQLCFMLMFLVPFMPFGSALSKAAAVLFLLMGYFGNYFVSSYMYYWGNSFVESDKIGIFSARKEMISLLSGVAVQLISGIAVDRLKEKSIELAFAFCAASIFIYCLLDFVTLLMIDKRDLSPEDSRQVTPIKEILSSTMGRKDYRSTVWLSCLYKVAIYSVAGFVGTYKLRELGLSMTVIQVINVVSAMARFAVSVPFGKYSDKHSYIGGFELGLIVMAVSSLALVFTSPSVYWLIIAYSVLYHISLGGTSANLLNMTYDAVNDKYFTEALAVKNAISGLAGFLTSVICGKIMTMFQTEDRFMFGCRIYGQQLLSLISFIITCVCIVYAKQIKKNLKKECGNV